MEGVGGKKRLLLLCKFTGLLLEMSGYIVAQYCSLTVFFFVVVVIAVGKYAAATC